MTTVGYGDVYPTTFFGKITGGFCVIAGKASDLSPIFILIFVIFNFCSIWI